MGYEIEILRGPKKGEKRVVDETKVINILGEFYGLGETVTGTTRTMRELERVNAGHRVIVSRDGVDVGAIQKQEVKNYTFEEILDLVEACQSIGWNCVEAVKLGTDIENMCTANASAKLRRLGIED